MRKRAWTKKEDIILLKNYSSLNKDSILNLLPCRTWNSIKIRASKFKLRHNLNQKYSLVEGDLEALLEDNCLSYYWMGFLTADGCFNNNRLRLRLSIKDLEHIKKFAKFIKAKFSMNLKACTVAVQDKFNICKIVKKYDLKKSKTYNPPNFNCFNPQWVFPFFIGFIDGDGSIVHQFKRKDCSLKIKIHSSWKEFLQKTINLVFVNLEISPVIVKINKKGYAEAVISNSIALRYLKTEALKLNLPFLERKWNKVNENYYSRREISKKNKIKILNLKSQGMRSEERRVGKECRL